MLFYMNLISIVLAVSLDGFGVGMTYGIRNIRLTVPALFIIMLCSGTIVLLSMQLGHVIRAFIPGAVTDALGGAILFLLGLIVLLSNLKQKYQLPILNHHFLSALTRMLEQPQKADKDNSGIISGTEAFLLGIALAMDAFGAGFAAALIGYPSWLMAFFIAMMSGLFLYTGIKTGNLLAKSPITEKLSLLPPILLIGIGLYNILA